jgi:hypothetical protein
VKLIVLISNIRRLNFVLSRVHDNKALVLGEATRVYNVYKTAFFRAFIHARRNLMVIVSAFISKNNKVRLGYKVEGVYSKVPSNWLYDLRKW